MRDLESKELKCFTFIKDQVHYRTERKKKLKELFIRKITPNSVPLSPEEEEIFKKAYPAFDSLRKLRVRLQKLGVFEQKAS
jgi:hypothetical protein